MQQCWQRLQNALSGFPEFSRSDIPDGKPANSSPERIRKRETWLSTNRTRLATSNPHPGPLPSDGRGRIVGSRSGNRTVVRGSWSRCMRKSETRLSLNLPADSGRPQISVKGLMSPTSSAAKMSHVPLEDSWLQLPAQERTAAFHESPA